MDTPELAYIAKLGAGFRSLQAGNRSLLAGNRSLLAKLAESQGQLAESQRRPDWLDPEADREFKLAGALYDNQKLQLENDQLIRCIDGLERENKRLETEQAATDQAAASLAASLAAAATDSPTKEPREERRKPREERRKPRNSRRGGPEERSFFVFWRQGGVRKTSVVGVDSLNVPMARHLLEQHTRGRADVKLQYLETGVANGRGIVEHPVTLISS